MIGGDLPVLEKNRDSLAGLTLLRRTVLQRNQPRWRGAMNAPSSKAKSLFLNAVEIADPGERRAYLDDECADDEGLRREIEDFLKHHQGMGSFLESSAPVVSATLDELPLSEIPGTIIGPYKLLEQIGEGGFGAVFMAEQQEPIRRKVALKILKPGLDSKQVLARFEAERQALALMDHPNIAKVLDAGTIGPNPPTPFPKREGGGTDSPSPLRGG